LASTRSNPLTILVTGATGQIGRHVVDQLIHRGADVRAHVRDPAKANPPADVAVVQGDLLDTESLRGAFSGVSTLFLLNAVAADEFTQALIVLNLAREADIERIVYLPVIHSDLYVNVPHFVGKFGVERMIEQMGFNTTILRPAYFIQNDLTIKDVVTGSRWLEIAKLLRTQLPRAMATPADWTWSAPLSWRTLSQACAPRRR
jgi:uncharacterized protein YbjT (DUF2867 family)